MSGRPAALLLVGVGLLLALAGVLAYFGFLSWFGRLPGDVRVERENFRLYVPLASMLVVSAGLSTVLWIVRRFM